MTATRISSDVCIHRLKGNLSPGSWGWGFPYTAAANDKTADTVIQCRKAMWQVAHIFIQSILPKAISAKLPGAVTMALNYKQLSIFHSATRSEERRVGKEGVSTG